MNLKGPKAGLVMLLLFILFLIFLGSSKISPESTAKSAAEELVKDELVAPSTAKFIETEIIDQKDNRYMVKVTVDAQNAFGAMIRGHFLVVLKVINSESVRYTWIQNKAVMQVSDPPTEEEISLMKDRNNWNSS